MFVLFVLFGSTKDIEDRNEFIFTIQNADIKFKAPCVIIDNKIIYF